MTTTRIISFQQLVRQLDPGYRTRPYIAYKFSGAHNKLVFPTHARGPYTACIGSSATPGEMVPGCSQPSSDSSTA